MLPPTVRACITQLRAQCCSMSGADSSLVLELNNQHALAILPLYCPCCRASSSRDASSLLSWSRASSRSSTSCCLSLLQGMGWCGWRTYCSRVRSVANGRWSTLRGRPRPCRLANRPDRSSALVCAGSRPWTPPANRETQHSSAVAVGCKTSPVTHTHLNWT